MIEVVVEGLEEVIKERIKRARGKDEKIMKMVEEIKKIEVSVTNFIQLVSPLVVD